MRVNCADSLQWGGVIVIRFIYFYSTHYELVLSETYCILQNGVDFASLK